MIIILFVLFTSPLTANNRQGVEVQLVLNTKVYMENDFRSEALTYIKKGEKVTVMDYSKGFFIIQYKNQTGYITEANIKICEEFQKFKYDLFSKKENNNTEDMNNLSFSS